jgi:hypothetical protein
VRVWRSLSPPDGSRPFLAMQKVVGSSPIIRFLESSTFSSNNRK